MKPIIGVIPLWDDEKESIWMIPGYMDVIKLSGGIPIILPQHIDDEDIDSICQICSGFLFTGGQDVDPHIYNQEPTELCGVANIARDSLEAKIFDYALEHDKPVFGICRGIQLINALCGGTLYQDLPTEYPSCTTHQMHAPYDRHCHNVTIIEGSTLASIVGSGVLSVNSYHHQAIKELAPTLRATAISEDGLIEAVEMPDRRFIGAVQWHPELNYLREDSSRKIIAAFINACSLSH